MKMTIGAFRFLDVYDTYRDLGWQPAPLLVVREVRTAFTSLMNKDYGINGTTAEELGERVLFVHEGDDERHRLRRRPGGSGPGA